MDDDWDEDAVRIEIEKQHERANLGKAGFVEVDEGVWVAYQHIQKVVLGASVQLVSGETVPIGNGYTSVARDLESAIWSVQRRWTTP